MKKLLSFILALAVSFTACGAFAACSCNGETARIKIISTIFPMYDFAMELTVDVPGVSVTSLVGAGGEAHGFTPSVRQLSDITLSDVFIYVGGDSDGWVSSADLSKTNSISLFDDCSITLLCYEGDHDHEHADGHSHEHSYDEHVWTDPNNAILIVNKLAATLKEIDPDYAEVYERNRAEYVQKLTELDDLLESTVNSAENKKIVVGDRFPFLYLTSRYGLEHKALFNSCSDQNNASAADIAALADFVAQNGVKTVFYIENSDRKMANAIVEAADLNGASAKTALLHSCQVISKSEQSNGETYLSLMTKNAQALAEAL